MSIPTIKKQQLTALIGNPNVGKSSIFNQLTGLNQKIGNYPGVTVDKTYGMLKGKAGIETLIDLPGIYSLHPKSEDEVIAFRVIAGIEQEKPDQVLVVLDATNLERSLFLGTQLIDLGIPLAFILNMKDIAETKGISIKAFELFKILGVPVILTDARHNEGISAIKDVILSRQFVSPKQVILLEDYIPKELTDLVKNYLGLKMDYEAFLAMDAVTSGFADFLKPIQREWILEKINAFGIDISAAKKAETQERQQIAGKIFTQVTKLQQKQNAGLTGKIDNVFLHPVFGYLIFASVLLLVFQAIFAWAEFPMTWIETSFAFLASWTSQNLPPGPLTDLFSEGIIQGIGGIVIFVPQIALLFGFLAILEDTGYLSRIVFLMDRIMKPFGMHGKSVVPLISGMACAIPGIMATRTISNNREKLITILVTPWMSCSARLPVYIILIGLTVPEESYLGISLQAMALLAMYMIGIIATLAGAFVLDKFFSKKSKSYLITELPIYRIPRWKTVLMTMYSKSRIFVLEAGKVILAISIVLWVLASYGPGEQRERLESEREMLLANASEQETEKIESDFQAKMLESSYIGIVGKAIEPVIRPLGYDWKIGIALLTSFAAREVFVGTMATIYAIGGDVEDELTIRERLSQETHPNSDEKVFDRATGFSLMIFYAFAMQCMSTLAVVYRETKSWKWPIYQTIAMTVVAYLAAFVTYQLFS
jgi:ferrous iron transport protein B